MNKIIVRLFLPFFLIYSILIPRSSYAVLPAVVFAELAGAAVDSFVIRSVAVQTVATVGTAANDASFVSTFLGWMNTSLMIGSLAFLVSDSSGTKTLQVQVSPDALSDMTYAPTGYHFHQTYTVVAATSIDGLVHNITLDADDLNTQTTQFIAWWNSKANPNARGYAFIGCGDPWTNSKGGISYGCDWNDQYGVPTISFSFDSFDVEQADGIKRLLGQPGDWTADPNDPDWTADDIAAIQNVSALRLNGVSAAGNQSVIDLTSTSSGLNIEYAEQIAPDTLRKLSESSSPVQIPNSVTQTVAPGTISPSPGSNTNPNGNGTPNSSITFPDDYARTGEAADAANILAPTLNDISTSLSDISTVSDPQNITADDMPGFGDTFRDLLGWTLPPHVSVCPKPSVDLSNILGDGHVYTLTSHCDLMETYGPVLRSAMMVVFTIAALFTVLGA